MPKDQLERNIVGIDILHLEQHTKSIGALGVSSVQAQNAATTFSRKNAPAIELSALGSYFGSRRPPPSDPRPGRLSGWMHGFRLDRLIEGCRSAMRRCAPTARRATVEPDPESLTFVPQPSLQQTICEGVVLLRKGIPNV